MKNNGHIAWISAACALPCEDSRAAALQRQSELTKPPGALGRLETVAVQLASLQGTATPAVDRVHVTVFAGDHGVAAEGVSAFPQAVTAEMVKNFARGGAAINVAARQIAASLEVINMGTAFEDGAPESVRQVQLGPGTANLSREAAMSEEQCASALTAGRDCILRARADGAQLFIGGEMGIANTTSAAALACALLSRPAAELAGPGTGLDSKGVALKAQIIDRALALHRPDGSMPLEALRCLGGFEIAALTGAFIACGQQGIPVLVDGFITSVAALTAVRIKPELSAWLLFAHRSAEPGHAAVLQALAAQPLLDLGMRLGEGSGSAVAVPLLRQACALHNEMATFAEAQVSEKQK